MLMMLPWEAPTIFEGIPKSYFRMPRVVKDQRNKFENDDLFRQLSHESAVKYTGFKDRPLEERQMKFIANCQEGHTEVSVVQSGNQFTLMFNPTANPAYNNEGCDFDKELGKVHIKAGFILNGVCVLWRGWIDLQRLEGFGCLEFDESRAYFEDAMLKQQIDKQQACNNGQPPPPLGLLDHHHPLANGPPLPLGTSAANSLPPPPLGLNPSCLGPPGPTTAGLVGHPQPPPPPPVSLAPDSTNNPYGSAAIAAAAAAAFRQAISASGAGGPGQALHGLVGPQSSALAAAAAAAAAAANSNGSTLPNPNSLVGAPPPPHLAYTNGAPMHIPVSSIAASITRTTPPAQPISNQASANHNNNNGSNNNNNNNNNNSNSNSSAQQENVHHLTNSSRRQATKRAHADEQTQLEDVDVVSDINAHDLDFPPRRIFKTEPLSAVGHHHRPTRRAV